MIFSIVNDEQWRADLEAVPAWKPSLQPALVVAPHPDDETLGAGALISTLCARGVPVTVVAVTDGENAYETAADERVRLGSIREEEQTLALQRLGVPMNRIHRLRMTDSGLMAQEQQIITRILELVDSGMQIIAPWDGDFHPDHIACARAARAVSSAKNIPLVSYFFWTWHRGTIDILAGLALGRFVPDEFALRAKTEALACHRSQLENDDEDPVLPERLLGPARWPFEVFVHQ